MKVKGLLERLDGGEVLLGDGGYLIELEKRGYVMAGPWTPEVVLENPDAVEQLHKEFIRSGSDIIQSFTFYASEDKLNTIESDIVKQFGVSELNRRACRIAKGVAKERGTLVAAGITQTPSYREGRGKEVVQEEFQKQIDVFVEEGVDFIIAEQFYYAEEMEWAMEVVSRYDLPTCCTMSLTRNGDSSNHSVEECALRMARSGADVIGINCALGPFESLQIMERIKRALHEAGIQRHLMIQPLGIHTPEAQSLNNGWIDLPEQPLALEPRQCTRWDFMKFARTAYSMGVRYIGGCCWTQGYHIRAMAEELKDERNRLPIASSKHGGLDLNVFDSVRERSGVNYWKNMIPRSGRSTSSTGHCLNCINSKIAFSNNDQSEMSLQI